MIHYLKNNEIDYAKWDACITSAHNRLIYGFSWYLDIVCDDWDALVLGDYEAVFPLPKRKKWGVSYIYQPFFCQQLGIFSNKKTLDIDLFLKSIPKYFKYVELNIFEKKSKYIKNHNTNFELLLQEGYQLSFSKNTVRNISKGQKSKLSLFSNISPEGHFSSFKNNLKKLGIQKKDAAVYLKLCYYLMSKNKGVLYSVFNSSNSLVASALIAKDANRVFYLNGIANDEGKKSGASHWMLSEVMKEYQGKMLDFEGSNIEGVARFYKGFGATKTIYSTIKINRLPFFLRWLKS